MDLGETKSEYFKTATLDEHQPDEARAYSSIPTELRVST